MKLRKIIFVYENCNPLADNDSSSSYPSFNPDSIKH